MYAKTGLMVAGLIGALASPAMSQYRAHADLGGYTLRTPNSTYMYRFETGATYARTGNVATYSDNSGTTGTILYAPTFRMDSFGNPREGWSGNGTTYYRPQFSTYGRTYPAVTPNIYRGSYFRPSLYRMR